MCVVYIHACRQKLICIRLTNLKKFPGKVAMLRFLGEYWRTENMHNAPLERIQEGSVSKVFIA